MITLKDVKKAKENVDDFLYIYQTVFFDSKKRPKLRLWLKKHGVKREDIEDVENALVITLAVGIDKYNHDKVPFEKWIWEKFRFCLGSYFQSKKLKKYSNIITLSDVYSSEDDKMEYDGKTVDIGYVTDEKVMLDMDFEHLVSKMNDIQSFICKCKFHNGWSDKEIRNFLNQKGITDKQYSNELKKVISTFKLYFQGKL